MGFISRYITGEDVQREANQANEQRYQQGLGLLNNASQGTAGLYQQAFGDLDRKRSLFSDLMRQERSAVIQGGQRQLGRTLGGLGVESRFNAAAGATAKAAIGYDTNRALDSLTERGFLRDGQLDFENARLQQAQAADRARIETLRANFIASREDTPY